MRRTRDANRGPAYEEWVAERAKEIQEEQRQRDAAAAADEAAEAARIEADPILSYQKSTNELYAGEQNIVLHGVVDERYLAKFGTIKRGRCSEEQKVTARTQFRQTATDYVRNNTNGATLCAMVARNGLNEGAVESYLLCHEILKIWAGYVDADPVEQPQPVRETQVEEPAQPVLTPSEQAAQLRHDYLFKIVAVDPRDPSKSFSESDLDKLPAEEARYIRRYAEKGNTGNNIFDLRMESLDAKFARDQEIARRGEVQQAAEDDGLDGPTPSMGQNR
ncbi:MAG TPA: hypothetical protein VN950_01205 [Terriglobales bacterium]|nr:hypothetical protein [Terriglobales bacterium]